MEIFTICSEAGVQVDYWSNMSQTFIINGFFNPDGVMFLPETELISKDGHQFIMVLRFFNCTGNFIDFTEFDTQDVTKEEIVKARIALSVDELFKNQRRRTVGQAIVMSLRQRVVSSGYFDYTIGHWVRPMTLENAAKCID